MTSMRAVVLMVFFLALTDQVSAQELPGARYDSVSVNGIQLAYQEVGTGDPLLLLHGFFGSSGTSWLPVIGELAAKYRLIAVDLPGHGRSSTRAEGFTHRQAAADIFALLDRLGIDAFKAMGFSSGGMTLLHMATSQPQRIEAMVVVGATSYFPVESREIMRSTTLENTTPERMNLLLGRHFNGRDQVDWLIRAFNGFKDSYADMNFTPPLLSRISAATLVIHGDRDEHFPVEIPLQQYRSIPKVYLWIVPNGRHVALPSTPAKRAAFAETVLEFLEGQWP